MKDIDDIVSVSLGLTCAFLILVMSGCTTLSANEIKDAVVAKREQRKHEQCSSPQPHPGIVVIIKEE